MILSVLIPSVPRRREMALSLFDEITDQAKGLPVEVLMLLDNKQRSIGMKRQALLDIAKGEYVAFADDDDEVSSLYIPSILACAKQSADVIVFDSLCSINGARPAVVRHGLAFENEQYNPVSFRRKPWHIHAWKREIAQRFTFPDVSYGEDWGWCSQMIEHVKTEARVGVGPLYTYRFDAAVTEAA